MSGFYLMHRGWQANAVFGRDVFSRRDAWIWLIEEAKFSPVTIGIGPKKLTLQRGQLSHSLRFMASAWGWDEARVRRFLSRLQNENMIACVVDAGQKVISVCNYDEYQIAERVGDAQPDAATTQQRRSNDANNNEGNELNKIPSSLRSEAEAEAQGSLQEDEETDMKAILFDRPLAWLIKKTGRPERECRAIIGKWLKANDESTVIDAMRAAQRCRDGPPIEPVSWITQWFKENGNGQTKQADARRTQSRSDELLRRAREIQAASRGNMEFGSG